MLADDDSIAMDAAYDEYMLSLYEEHKEEAIKEFRSERLQSYYEDHPDVAEKPLAALNEARVLLHTSASLTN